MSKKVFVSGCFDLLHSGHIAFFQEAASYGDLFVAIGSDKTVFDLKGRRPVNSEDERLFMIKSVAFVTDAFVSQGSGMLDFAEELKQTQPDLFIVNEDGNIPEKQDLCRSLGIDYSVLKREPLPGLSARSTTLLRAVDQIPYRLDLAGGWLDQPFVSKLYPGPVLTISVEPTIEFNERSGMASSTRRSALELWGPRLPRDNYAKLAKVLFCFDNPPGTREVSGSQDAIGITFPGLAKAFYDGEYWPSKIDSVRDESTLRFVEQALYLIPIGPRFAGYNVLSETQLSSEGVKALAEAAEACWTAILEHNLTDFGLSMRQAFEVQISMFPHMSNAKIFNLIDHYKDKAAGWKLSGAGGGGYLVLVADTPIDRAVRLAIRRADN